jgi:sulfur-carrier protein
MAQVYLPSSLARLFAGEPRKVDLDAGSVSELMWRLNASWPGMRDRLCTSDGAIRRHITIFVDGERASLDTPIQPGAEVRIIPAVSGG